MDKISVIVPVYNVEHYLKKCIESIQRQTWTNLEILLIDDGSTDASGQICDAMADKDARIRVIHQKNTGVSAARNRGLREASGAYLAFVDADDWLEEGMYAYLMQLLKRYQAELASCRAWVTYEASGRQKEFPGEPQEGTLEAAEALEALHEGKVLRGYIWDKLYSRTLLPAMYFREDLVFAEDYAMLCTVLERCRKVAYGGLPMYHYLQRNFSACTRGYDASMQRTMQMFGQFYQKHCKQYPQYRDSFVCHYLFNLMGIAAAMARNKNYEKTACRMIKTYIRKHLMTYVMHPGIACYQKGSACVMTVSVRLFGRIYRKLYGLERKEQ